MSAITLTPEWFLSRRNAYGTWKRFWKNVKPEKSERGCWVWTGPLNDKGYGRIYASGGGHNVARAHQLSWLIFSRTIPAKAFLCHHCDNRKCVNPDHLFLGTALDNMRDAVAKGRAVRGERQGSHKLTEKQVIAILSEYRPRIVSQRMLAQKYGINQSGIWRILIGDSWKHVPRISKKIQTCAERPKIHSTTLSHKPVQPSC